MWVKGLGYDFTGEKLKQAAAELTDEDLELAAGDERKGGLRYVAMRA